MDEQNHTNEYRTGRTRPQKNYSGLIAVLLICVIFLMGLVSVLSYMNLRLFRYLKQSALSENASLSFSTGDTSLPTETTAEAQVSLTLTGMTLQELSVPYQQMFNLPQGLYISAVAVGSNAETLGISPGDVLISFADTPVSSLDSIQNLYVAQPAGSNVPLVIYRNGTPHRLTLTLEQEE